MEKINLKIKVSFYDYNQGGRIKPVCNGYRTSILFGINKNQSELKGRFPIDSVDESLNSSGKFTDFSETPSFNKTIEATLTFNNYNPKIKKYFEPNESFIVFEGPRIVGKGIIYEIGNG
jgi:hypothetical protein